MHRTPAFSAPAMEKLPGFFPLLHRTTERRGRQAIGACSAPRQVHWEPLLALAGRSAPTLQSSALSGTSAYLKHTAGQQHQRQQRQHGLAQGRYRRKRGVVVGNGCATSAEIVLHDSETGSAAL